LPSERCHEDAAVPTSEAITRSIRVRVESRFDPERSEVDDGRWFFIYTIRISNEGLETVQLLSRHWIITDAEGEVEEVRGPGVVGEQPLLQPDQTFEYSSGCPLETPFGTMHGTYQMVTSNGEHFDVEIAPFALSLPYAIN
jgi:ApaG protein